MKIELLSFPGCPSVEATRVALVEAMRRVGIAGRPIDVDIPTDGAESARGWPSPTILVDGRDLEGLTRRSSGPACRLYRGRPAPGLAALERLLRRRARGGR